MGNVLISLRKKGEDLMCIGRVVAYFIMGLGIGLVCKGLGIEPLYAFILAGLFAVMVETVRLFKPGG